MFAFILRQQQIKEKFTINFGTKISYIKNDDQILKPEIEKIKLKGDRSN